MVNKIALIGYSGHALVVAETLMQSGYELAGYFEKEAVQTNPLRLKHLGFERDDDFISKAEGILLFPAIGNNTIRRKVMLFLLKKELQIANAVSTSANISSYTNIKCGTLICRGACINPFVNLGAGVIINTGAIIEHECNIDDYVHIAPGAVLAGKVQVGFESFIGANAVVKQNIKIGHNVTIGAGAVVIRDVPDNEVWIGNPARRIKIK